MVKFEIIMPKLGESVIEATISKWLKNPGDNIEEDDSIVEIATDKVDSEIPSPVQGILTERLYNEGDVVIVGKPIAIIEIEGDEDEETKAVKNVPDETESDIKQNTSALENGALSSL